MVHALKQVHAMLQPNGQLIEVHNLPVPHRIEIHSGESTTKAGWLVDVDDFDSERLALNAIAQVVSEGLLLLEDERDFDFDVHADDVPELQKWLTDGWKSAVIPERTLQRLEELRIQAVQEAGVVLKVQTRMICLSAA
jgi:hypothetical protein